MFWLIAGLLILVAALVGGVLWEVRRDVQARTIEGRLAAFERALGKPAADPANFGFSPDTGWFAADSDGRLALFQPGRPGPFLRKAKYTCGPFSEFSDWPDLLHTLVIPEMAQRNGLDFDKESFEWLLFDDSENAASAEELFEWCWRPPDNPRLVHALWDQKTAVNIEGDLLSLPGVIGVSASIWDSISGDDADLPVSVYVPVEDSGHGVPGEFRRANDVSQPIFVEGELAEELERMDTEFSSRAVIQLADFYAVSDFAFRAARPRSLRNRWNSESAGDDSR